MSTPALRRTRRTPWIGALALVCSFVPCALSAPPAALASRHLTDGEALPAAEARARLEQAARRLRDRKATGDELRAALDELAEAHARAPGTEREQRAFRRKAEAQLLKGLALHKSERRAPDVNVRQDLNVHAAELLGGTASVLDAKEAHALSLRIRKVLEEIRKDRKPDQWVQGPLDAAYAALAELNDADTLAWMLEEHHHSKERELPFLIAAHQAMPKFRSVAGRLRHEICKTLITAYSGVELLAERGSSSAGDRAKKRFWDQLRTSVIPVLQLYAGKPENEKGEALSTVAEFDRWFDEHDDVRKAPWRDD